jgi:2-methylisocitrate lyase-like PEP mutase family enzyme
MPSQQEKTAQFLALHQSCFVIPNPWDAGSARVLAGLGFKALATSSGGFAGTLGRRDGKVKREEAIGHARAVVEVVDIPVSADLENCFGHAPAFVAETVRMAGATGLAGCSCEDATGEKDRPLYPIEEATARVKAAVEAAKSLNVGFVITGRCEGFLRGVTELDEVIRRLKAYEAAGADVLMAPGLPDLAAVRAVCGAVSKPVNFMAGIKGRSFSVADLAAAGVKRISLATSLYRAAMTALVSAATEVKDKGTFGYIDTSIPTPALNEFMRG